MDNPIYADTGMLITVNRITEAEDMAKALGQHRAKLCVITSDAATNALGAHETADKAQVVISTQAALKLTLKALGRCPVRDSLQVPIPGAAAGRGHLG